MCPTPLSFHPLFRVESSLNLLFHFHLKRPYCVVSVEYSFSNYVGGTRFHPSGFDWIMKSGL